MMMSMRGTRSINTGVEGGREGKGGQQRDDMEMEFGCLCLLWLLSSG